MAKACICLQCGHEWTPRVDNPRQCPNCASQTWYEPASWVEGSGPAYSRARSSPGTPATLESSQDRDKMTDRERELVEAAKAFARRKNLGFIFPAEYQALLTALAYYEESPDS